MLEVKDIHFHPATSEEPILKGVNFTKDLVSEPGNILHPDEYAKRITRLKKIGLKINVYNTS